MKADSDDEMEAFEISEHDVSRAFDPFHNKRNQTKEDAIYGIWARESQEKFTRKPTSNVTSSRPVNFVQSGFANQPSDFHDTNMDEGITRSTLRSNDIQQNDMGMAKLYNKKSTSYSSTSSNQRGTNFIGNSDMRFAGFTSSDDVGQWERYTKGIGMKLLLKMGFQKGKGLGKKLQGRAVPVQALKRQGKGTVGSYGKEHADSDPKSEAGDSKSKIQHTQQNKYRWKKSSEKLPFSTNFGERQIARSRELRQEAMMKLDCTRDILDYETSFEILTDAQAPLDLEEDNLSPSGGMKIVDMTGREIKEYSSFRHLKEAQPLNDVPVGITQKKNRKSGFWELSYMDQLSSFVDRQIVNDEIKLMALDKRVEYNDNIKSTLEVETKRLNNLINRCLTDAETLNRILQTLQLCREELTNTVDPLEYLKLLHWNFHTQLQQDSPDLYQVLHLDDCLIELAAPVLEEIVQSRDIILDRDEIIEAFGAMDDQENAATAQTHKVPTAKDILLWEILAPAVRSFMLLWSAREPEAAVSLIETLKNHAPLWLVSNFVTQLILPKLQRELDEWNPLADSIPLNTWVHPWLPHLNRNSDSILTVMRHKISNALRLWHPSDNSARLILQPWRPPVFTTGAWHAFMSASIVPKLDAAMSESFVLNPANQDLTVWNWIMPWHGTLQDTSIIDILEKYFFPQFVETLRGWLAIDYADYEEIANWFSGWKLLLPESLRQHPVTKHYLDAALSIMQGALDTTSTGKPHDNPLSRVQAQTAVGSFDAHTADRTSAVRNPNVFYCSDQLRDNPQASLRDVLERVAMERNILFVPCPQLTDSGQRVYRLGSRRIYIDRFSIYVADERSKQEGPVFRRISLNDLLNSL